MLTLLVVFVVLPLVFHYSPSIQRHMVFLPWLKWPKNVDFDKPEDQGLDGARNFYLESEPGVKIGVWHILPAAESASDESGSDVQKRFNRRFQEYPTVIYMHGNTGSRARDPRIGTYKRLRALGYNVVAFDYRGYADSSNRVLPTKSGVITDALAVLTFVRDMTKGSGQSVFVWGHSLGTAVATASLSEAVKSDRSDLLPSALVLESPFNNIRDEIKKHPFSYLWRKMPNFDWLFAGSLHKGDVAFFTDKAVQNLHFPILILHAKDDPIVPHVLGEMLFEKVKESREASSKPVKFVSFEAERGLGHNLIHEAPELAQIVSEFFEKTVQNSWLKEDFARK